MISGGNLLKEYIEERAVAIANYIIDYNATVRQTARKFGISKSTVHKDVTDRLENINPSLAAQARVVLDINKAERHISCLLYTSACICLLSGLFYCSS